MRRGDGHAATAQPDQRVATPILRSRHRGPYMVPRSSCSHSPVVAREVMHAHGQPPSSRVNTAARGTGAPHPHNLHSHALGITHSFLEHLDCRGDLLLCKLYDGMHVLAPGRVCTRTRLRVYLCELAIGHATYVARCRARARGAVLRARQIPAVPGGPKHTLKRKRPP